MKDVSSRNMAFASSENYARRNTSQKYVTSYQDAEKLNSARKDTQRTAKDLLLEVVVGMTKNVPIITQLINMLQRWKRKLRSLKI